MRRRYVPVQGGAGLGAGKRCGGRGRGRALVRRGEHGVAQALVLRVHLLVHLHVAVEVDEQRSVPAAHVKVMKRRGVRWQRTAA